MGATVMLVMVVTVVVLCWFAFQRQAIRNPLWMAFTTTAIAALYLVSGFVGYRLGRHERFVAEGSWSSEIIWWEVSIGLMLVLIAVYFWRKGLDACR